MGKWKRRTRIDLGDPANKEILQSAAFPVDGETEPAGKLRENAREKESVAEAAKKIPEIFTPEQVEWCFDAYVAVLSFVYSITLKTDFKAIQEELAFTKEQKEMFSKPLARICSKYAPSEWAGMTAEIELITMMGVWTVSSFQRAKRVAEIAEEAKMKKEITRPVAPMRRSNAVTEIPA